MRKTHYRLERRSPRRGKGKKIHSRTKDGKQQGSETNGRIGIPNPHWEVQKLHPVDYPA